MVTQTIEKVFKKSVTSYEQTDSEIELFNSDYSYYDEEDLDFSLKETFTLLNNELKRLEKKIIITQLTQKHCNDNEDIWLDDEYLQLLESDLLYYKDKYECVKSALLNVVFKMKGSQNIEKDQSVKITEETVNTNTVSTRNNNEEKDSQEEITSIQKFINYFI